MLGEGIGELVEDAPSAVGAPEGRIKRDGPVGTARGRGEGGADVAGREGDADVGEDGEADTFGEGGTGGAVIYVDDAVGGLGECGVAHARGIC